MGKGLEALQSLRCMTSLSQDCPYIESNRLCDVVKTDLEAFEIIQNKFVLVEKMYDTKLVINIPLTKDEIDLLKEVLKHE